MSFGQDFQSNEIYNPLSERRQLIAHDSYDRPRPLVNCVGTEENVQNPGTSSRFPRVTPPSRLRVALSASRMRPNVSPDQRCSGESGRFAVGER